MDVQTERAETLSFGVQIRRSFYFSLVRPPTHLNEILDDILLFHLKQGGR